MIHLAVWKGWPSFRRFNSSAGRVGRLPYEIAFAYPGGAIAGTAMKWAVERFINLIILVFVLAFLSETALLLWEYRQSAGELRLAFGTHQFVFYPTFGILVLFLFRSLAVEVVTDALTSGFRSSMMVFGAFALSLIASAGLTYSFIQGGVASPWEIAPNATSSMSLANGQSCSADNLDIEHERIRDWYRTSEDPTIASGACSRLPTAEIAYCPVDPLATTSGQCCAVQESLQVCANVLREESPSRLLSVRAPVLFAKSTFILLIFALGLALAMGVRNIDFHSTQDRVDKGRRAVFGAILMASWPVLNHVYLQASDMMYGAEGGLYRRLAMLFAAGFLAWLLAIVSFVLRSTQSPGQAGLGRLVSLGSAVFGVATYERLLNLVARFAGPGAGWHEILAFVIIYATVAWQISALAVRQTPKSDVEPQS